MKHFNPQISPADSFGLLRWKTMKITDITVNVQTQSRVSINQDTVLEYSEAMTDGAQFPPIAVFYDGKDHYLADGYHRYFAAKKAGLEDIECTVLNGTLRDAVLYSVGVNANHGLRRTNEDKRKAVMTIFGDLEWSEWSDNSIANKCSVTGAFVGRVRKSLNIESKTKKFVNEKGNVVSIKTDGIGRPVDKVEPEDCADDRMQELAIAHIELAEENVLLKDRLAAAVIDATPEEKTQLVETLEQLRATIKSQEAEIVALKASRDGLQQKNADMIKQLAYWKKQAERVA